MHLPKLSTDLRPLAHPPTLPSFVQVLPSSQPLNPIEALISKLSISELLTGRNTIASQ